ncbi:aldo/keto reductase [Streptomyces pyxinicus]|uniref:aldo/keto reductase n=1 Tax=Streptomyces pyxinicus TaxID=2970331 RepID=UPI003D1749CD
MTAARASACAGARFKSRHGVRPVRFLACGGCARTGSTCCGYVTPGDEVMDALDDLVRSGKALSVGVSDWPAWEIARANALAERARGCATACWSALPSVICCRGPGRST